MKSWASWKSLCTIAGAVFASVIGQGCNPSSAPFPDVSKQVYLDTTGTVVNVDSITNQLTLFKGPTRSFERRATCPGCVVIVEVTRIGKTNDIDPDSGPSPARQIALFKNTDARDTTEMYHFLPGRSYVLQVGRGLTGAAVYTFIELPLAHTGILRVTARGGVTGCTPRHAPGPSKVGFANCYDHAWDPSFPGSALIDFHALRVMAVAIRDRLAMAFHGEMAERSAWFSCDYGCCTA